MKNGRKIVALLTVICLVILSSCNEFIEDFGEYSGSDIEIDDMLYVQTMTGLFVSRDNGVSFKQLTSLAYPFAADPEGNIVLVNPANQIYIRDQYGDFVSAGNYAATTTVAAAGDGTFYIGGASVMYRWRYENDIISLSDMVRQLTTPPLGIAAEGLWVLRHNGNRFLQCSNWGGTDYVSYDMGNVYTLLGTSYIYDAVNLDEDTILLADGSLGDTVIESNDGCRTFTQHSTVPLAGQAVYDVCVTDTGRIYVASQNLAYVCYSDGDLDTWVQSAYIFPGNISYLETGKEGRLFVVINADPNLYYSDDGVTFNVLFSFPNAISGMQHVIGKYPD